jgi:uncharacterized membrane protein YdjX (TVP38/TMEM64 family)
MGVDKSEVLRRVSAEGLFIMLPVVAILVIEKLNTFISPSIHESGLFTELTLAIMIFFADTLRDAAKEGVTWRKWKILKFVGFSVPIVGLLVIGNFLTVHSPKHEPLIMLVAVGAFLLWCAVKLRVVYSEISLRNYYLEKAAPYLKSGKS